MITRIITGVIGICLVAFVIQTGGTVFALCVTLLALIAWVEYARAFASHDRSISLTLGLLAILLLNLCTWQGNGEELFAIATAAMMLILLKSVLLHGKDSLEEAAFSMLGVFYIGLTFAHMILLRFAGAEITVQTFAGDMSLGCAFLWITFLGTWASDTFAYFVGYICGKHKLCPAISPKKTVEGFIGGLLGTIIVVTALGVSLNYDLLTMAGLGLCMGIIAPLGDLVESVVKRYAGVKDSGKIIPGHGGILDRFDSVMFTAPIVYYFVEIFLLP